MSSLRTTICDALIVPSEFVKHCANCFCLKGMLSGSAKQELDFVHGSANLSEANLFDIKLAYRLILHFFLRNDIDPPFANNVPKTNQIAVLFVFYVYLKST